jgi:hypothetical protein
MKIRLSILLSLIFIGCTDILNAQNVVDWDGKYIIQLSDFRSSSTEIGGTNVYSLYSSSSVDFSYHMSNAEFMFTKNFNSKVSCSFKPYAASLIAPDSATALSLVEFARFDFDLCELYARKLRKDLYERKGAFSDSNFFQPLYEENQRELTNRHQAAAKASDVGRNKEILDGLHKDVLAELNLLSDFCKSCKPNKKK